MNGWTFHGLNPCCNGIYLIIPEGAHDTNQCIRLNPCCNVIYLIIKENLNAIKNLIQS